MDAQTVKLLYEHARFNKEALHQAYLWVRREGAGEEEVKLSSEKEATAQQVAEAEKAIRLRSIAAAVQDIGSSKM